MASSILAFAVSDVGSDVVDRDRESFVEVDPSGRYGRYSKLLGSGCVKKVYRAFDQEERIEVAWNQVQLTEFCEDEVMIKRLYSEVKLLRTLNNKNIIKALSEVWLDKGGNTLNFITEMCTSGNLREYRKKHGQVSIEAIKKWSRQILKGLDYLHNQEPCIIHRDLHCGNVFINGNIGQVKIGDLGLAAKSSPCTETICVEFMAPELFYDQAYTESIDIYSFGMCVLEMVTNELPYSECYNVREKIVKVTMGVIPQAMYKVKDPEVKAFIEKCLAKPRARPSASDLLDDPFFDGIENNYRSSHYY